MANASVLIADITGSTALYERLDQQDALNRVSLILARMRTIIEETRGYCVKSQGDDTLSVFRRPGEGFEAARQMLQDEWDSGLSLHAGLSFGEVLRHGNDVYGNAVNTAARLAALAKPGELLVDGAGFDLLAADGQDACVSLGGITLKGKMSATRVFSYTSNLQLNQTQTVFLGKSGPKPGRRTESVEVTAGQAGWTLLEGQSLSVGRSEDCDIVFRHGWVSRQHGKLELRGQQLEFTDHSSAGSIVLTDQGQEFEVHRRTTLLSGEGHLLFGTNDRNAENSSLRYATNDLIPE